LTGNKKSQQERENFLNQKRGNSLNFLKKDSLTTGKYFQGRKPFECGKREESRARRERGSTGSHDFFDGHAERVDGVHIRKKLRKKRGESKKAGGGSLW